MKRSVLVIVVTALILSLSGCGYNEMQSQEEAVFRAWGDLEAQLQRRYDLIPNLVATVQGAANFEQETLTNVVDARSRVGSIQFNSDDLSDPEAVQRFTEAQGQLSSALSRLLVVTENYPEIRATEAFTDLQIQLEGTENRISVARQRYNQAVETFNSSIRRFPNSLINSTLLQLERKEYFQAASGAEEAPRVQF